MPLTQLDHCSIRTTKLEETRAFYVDVLGLAVGPRPEFPFPGVWLYRGAQAVMHIIGIDPDDASGLQDYLGERSADASGGTGTIDHIAFTATGLAEMRAQLTAAGLEFRERAVPKLALHQIFIVDPNGVTLELNYAGADLA